jgi:hypothetical protein
VGALTKLASCSAFGSTTASSISSLPMPRASSAALILFLQQLSLHLCLCLCFRYCSQLRFLLRLGACFVSCSHKCFSCSLHFRFPTQPNDLATNPSRGYFSAVNKTLRNHAIQSHYSSATLADKFKCSDDNRLIFRAIHIFMSNLMFEMEQKIDELMTQLTIPLTEDEALRSNLDWTAPEVPLALLEADQQEQEPLDAEQPQTEQYHNTNEHQDPNTNEHQDPNNNPTNTSSP